MKKYKLIKTYPGSPKLGDEISNKFVTAQNHFYHSETGKLSYMGKPEEYPEYWEEVKQKDYEILSFKNKVCGDWFLQPNGQYKFSDTCIKSLDLMLNSESNYIHSIKRLSDGEIFTIGDKVIFNNEYKFIIEQFTICEGEICCGDMEINYIKKVKKPLDYKILCYSHHSNRNSHSLTKRDDTWDIHEVERVSDGVKFKLYERVKFQGNGCSDVTCITKIIIEGDILYICSPTCQFPIKFIEKLKPLFKTEDGVEIFDLYKDSFYYVRFTKSDYHNPLWEILVVDQSLDFKYEPNVEKYFSTKQAAEEYVIMNKPCLSINEVFNLAPLECLKKLIEIVKSKQN